MKAQIESILRPKQSKRIRPEFVVTEGTSAEARAFLDKNHYLGAASGVATIEARYRNTLVGVWVFMKRNQGEILWHRACWDHNFRSWNPHETALKLALPILKSKGFTKMVTFSDNRFHTGGLYRKLGFGFEKELKPNYYYVSNSGRRLSKYALRVKAGIREVESARSKGWYRMWDSGKKRFTLDI